MSKPDTDRPLSVFRDQPMGIGAKMGAVAGLVALVALQAIAWLAVWIGQALGPEGERISQELAQMLKTPSLMGMYVCGGTFWAVALGALLGTIFAWMIRTLRSRGHTHKAWAIGLGALIGLLLGAVSLVLAPVGAVIGGVLAWRIDARLSSAEGGVDNGETEEDQ